MPVKGEVQLNFGKNVGWAGTFQDWGMTKFAGRKMRFSTVPQFDLRGTGLFASKFRNIKGYRFVVGRKSVRCGKRLSTAAIINEGLRLLIFVLLFVVPLRIVSLVA